MKTIRYLSRPTTSRADGAQVISFGIRVGYWPCLHAPFIQFALGYWLIDIWYGLPSYLKTNKPNNAAVVTQ